MPSAAPRSSALTKTDVIKLIRRGGRIGTFRIRQGYYVELKGQRTRVCKQAVRALKPALVEGADGYLRLRTDAHVTSRGRAKASEKKGRGRPRIEGKKAVVTVTLRGRALERAEAEARATGVGLSTAVMQMLDRDAVEA